MRPPQTSLAVQCGIGYANGQGKVANISIPGAQGSTLTFTITGNAAQNLATDFASSVRNATVTTTITPGSPQSTVAGALNIIASSGQYNLTTGGQYTYASVSSATTIDGSASGGDTILAGGGVTYTAGGGANRIGFFAGNNIFDGGTTSGNTVTGGEGNDTINAGTGSTTIFGGTGNAVINLSDSAGSGDVVVLQGGNSTVNASGAADTIFASSGADINGGSSALVFVSSPDPGTGAAPDPVTVVSGAGGAYLFGVNGTDIVLQGTASAGLSVFVAGQGNETLNAADAAGTVAFFANTTASDPSSVSESVTGGSGNDFFQTGTGDEYFQSGSGTDLFDIASVAGGSVTIAGFTSTDFVQFQGLDAAQAGSLVSGGTVSGGNLTVSLSDGTTVEFIGVTSLSGHVL
jgi:Ca2+-binding RTX toxin-like protein